jgi:hypothetical protein
MPLPITTPLPIVSEGDDVWVLSAEWANLLAEKVEAFSNIQADAPLKITKSDAGFKITVEE